VNSPAIHVVAGVLRDACGRVLIAQRTWRAHLAGAWEFPGGKLRPGESPPLALSRELREELGIEVEQAVELVTLTHDYPDRTVLLEFLRVAEWRGEPRGLEGQRLRWEMPGRLLATGLLPADQPVAAMLSRLSDRT
jgi:8-oxo-dGTP diphosphatase